VSLRIVAGEFGGRRIEAPPGRETRPTREVVREAWFSALGGALPGARVLDLYAGSGALGLEALSRGASKVHFVEADRRACAVLRRNLHALDVEQRTQVTRGEALSFVSRLSTVDHEFDIVLADPPYESEGADRLVRRFVKSPFAGLLCVEHGPADPTEVAPAWRRRYGDTILSFFRAGAGGASVGD
jgi:16S rRNA (guanine966-N2)-methyltransferase